MSASRILFALCLLFSTLSLGVSGGSAFTDSPAPLADSITIDTSHDTWINADAVSINYGADKELWTGRYSLGSKTYERRTLLWFDISVLPADAIGEAATLELDQVAADGEKFLDIWPLLV